ncbi:hypothetical protein Dimus_011352, partial [Dionaea muscipula]
MRSEHGDQAGFPGGHSATLFTFDELMSENLYGTDTIALAQREGEFRALANARLGDEKEGEVAAEQHLEEEEEGRVQIPRRDNLEDQRQPNSTGEIG